MGVSHNHRADHAANRLRAFSRQSAAMPQPRVERPTTPPPPPGHARIRPAGHPPQRAQSGLRQATRDKRALSDLIGVRSADAVGESARLTRDQPRLSFTIGHALAVILLLIVALGISLALLVQQSMNMAMLSQPTAMQTTGGSAGDQTMPSQNDNARDFAQIG